LYLSDSFFLHPSLSNNYLVGLASGYKLFEIMHSKKTETSLPEKQEEDMALAEMKQDQKLKMMAYILEELIVDTYPAINLIYFKYRGVKELTEA